MTVHGIDVARMSGSALGDLDMISMRNALTQLRTELGEEAFAQVQEAAYVVRDVYRDILERKVAAELISRETADLLHETYPWYNPIKYSEHIASGVVDGIPRRSIAGVTSNDLHNLAEFGRTIMQENPLDILPQTIANAETAIARNRAARAIVADALMSPELKHQVTRMIDIPTTGAPTPGSSLARAGDVTPPGGALAGDVAATGPEQFTRQSVKEIFKIRGGPKDVGLISFFRNGEQSIWQVPKWMADHTAGLSNFDQHLMERVGRMANSPLRAVWTSHNPAFMAVSFMFDMVTVAVMEGILPHETFVSLLASMKNIFKTDETIRQMILNRGSVQGLTGRSAEEIARGLNRPGRTVINSLDDWRTYRDLALAPPRILNRLSTAFEQAARRSVFQKGLQTGLSPEEAAFASRRATVDFQRYGKAIRLADAWFLYLNAGIQGSILPVRGLLNPNIRAPLKPLGRALPGLSLIHI